MAQWRSESGTGRPGDRRCVVLLSRKIHVDSYKEMGGGGDIRVGSFHVTSVQLAELFVISVLSWCSSVN